MRPNPTPLSAAITLGLLALASLLAGCLQSEDDSTARATLPVAEADAKSWDRDARLVGIVGTEGRLPGGLHEGFGWYRGPQTSSLAVPSSAPSDSQVGDGRCEGWVYRFLAGDGRRVLSLFVWHNGTVLSRSVESARSDDRPVGAWRIDSDEAVRLAKRANGGLQKAAESQHAGLVEILRPGTSGDAAEWLVAGGGGGENGGGGGQVLIDAVTGRVLSSQGGYGPAAEP